MLIEMHDQGGQKVTLDQLDENDIQLDLGRVVLCDFGTAVKCKKGEVGGSVVGDLQIRARKSHQYLYRFARCNHVHFAVGFV